MALSLNMMRDCRFHIEGYHSSALVLNYINLGSVVVITTLNILIVAFDPMAVLL